MKKLRGIRLLMAFVGCCFLYGCGLDLIAAGVITGVDAYQIKQDIASMDVKGKIKGDIGLMKMVSAQVFEEMGITVVEVEPQQGESAENYIKGKTDRHDIIEIAWESVTPKMFSVGVKARYPGIGFFETNKDINFAIEILTLIDAKYRVGIIVPKTNVTPSAIVKTLRVVKEGLVRQGPGSEFKVIAVVGPGSILVNLGRQKSWHKIQTETGKVGFIYYTIVKPAPDI